MSLRVFWSDRLETMADRILDEWTARLPRDPFERTCVVVGDMATRNWLKERFLLRREPGARRVLANMDFQPLPEFANDWLAAAVHGREVAEGRDPAEHPFSKGVMAWRIDAILREKAADPAFATLAGYVAAGGKEAEDRRRFDLAVRLAQMFDDYLVSRHATLLAWERGRIPDVGDERWQALLYRELARGTRSGSYAADYAHALGPDVSPAAAFDGGFPRYAAVHVFDVPDAPWPYLEMLKKLSEEIPVSFWTFNPLHDFWMENPTRRQLLREKAGRLRKALENGETPPDEPDDPDFSSPDARLLGALATGARGLLAHELDLAGGDYDWLGGSGSFDSLRRVALEGDAEVHVCHSARRELEAARDALHRFFKEHPDAKPSDALVLCADWATYSPLVEAVFGGEDARGSDGAKLPVATAGIRASTPVAHSFGELLDFRTNRFEVSRVFSLLGVPEIRDKFGIGADGLPVLREMVRNDNVHWGWDAADVRSILGQEPGDDGELNRFTWRRGLDRLTLDALLGPREDEEALYEAGELGRLLPGGHVESDRAELVGGLHRFAKRLAALRRFLKDSHSAEGWRDGLLGAVDDFYKPGDSALGDVLGLRRAVESAAAAAVRARETDRRAKDDIPGEVFCRAVLDAVKDGVRPLSPAGDAVRVVPLANGSAVPARFVWICGLNDGTFPRDEYRPTFDLVGRHPTMYDVTPRERDALALLKAAMGARDRLCLSYVGRDIRTNEAIPPAVPLTDLLEWFAAVRPARTIVHPLQSYSGRYFSNPSDLPRSHSAANHAAAAALAAARAGGATAADALPKIVPFPLREDGATEIELDDLAEFCAAPNWFLATKRLRIFVSDPRKDLLDDEDALGGTVPKGMEIPFLTGEEDLSDATVARVAERLAESGAASGGEEAADMIREAVSEQAIGQFRSQVVEFAQRSEEQKAFGCPHDPLYDKFEAYDAGMPVPFPPVAFDIGGKTVRIVGSFRPPAILTNSAGNPLSADLVFLHAAPYPSDWVRRWIRHLVRQIVTGPVAMVLFWPAATRLFVPVPVDEARRRLSRILELATAEVPVDLENVRGADDKPPEAFTEPLDYDEYRKYKGKKSGKKGATK